MAKSKRSAKIKCPRCGLLGWIQVKKIGNKEYVYVVHYEKGKRSYCYLGPKAYTYVTRTHLKEGLILRGLADNERAIAYLDALISYLERNPLSPEIAESLTNKLELLARGLREYARRGETKKRANQGA